MTLNVKIARVEIDLGKWVLVIGGTRLDCQLLWGVKTEKK
ncbi:uncharacterized protein G2W53_023684 [Senna tora]|uniref:Uncharacterized protein n=1 Tax=Senna tora TaxID=362788 RepID=A0A834TB45_9FABA|nr:uncharacterized protein G2W53_023684 [Senna tora]